MGTSGLWDNLDDMVFKHDTDAAKWPVCREDGLQRSNQHYSCFISLEQLHNWFSHTELKMLSSHGYDVVTLDAEVYQASDKQALCYLPE